MTDASEILGTDRPTGDGASAAPASEATAGDSMHSSDPQDEASIRVAGRTTSRSISVDELRLQILQSLRAGMTLPDDVFDGSGLLLLAAGSQITPRFLHLLAKRGIESVELVPAPPERRAVAAKRLRCGVGSATAATGGGRYGSTTGGGRYGSTTGGDRSVPSRQDACGTGATGDGRSVPSRQDAGGKGATASAVDPSQELDECLAAVLQTGLDLRPVKSWRRPRLSIENLQIEASIGTERHAMTRDAVADLTEAVAAGRSASAAEVRRSVTRFVDTAALDFDLLPLIVSMHEYEGDYLYSHCVNVALLSVAMASHLGLSRETVTEIGLGGLLHDIGMLRVPPDIRLAPRALNTEEWSEIRRHPLYTLELFEPMRRVPRTVKLISYQVHERIDGNGYPRRRIDRQLHQAAQIVAIADVYIAMTAPRPYRPAMRPYGAAKLILTAASRGKFNKTLVRAFLDTVSLFPVGSRVRLSNGTLARVLRANPSLHTRPVVEELTPDGHLSGCIVDLSQEHAVRVVGTE